MSAVMHAFHAGKMAGLTDAPVPPGGAVPSAAMQACYQCHPGATTQCLRGAMTTRVDCQNCHGDMAAVGRGGTRCSPAGASTAPTTASRAAPGSTCPAARAATPATRWRRRPWPARRRSPPDGIRFLNAFRERRRLGLSHPGRERAASPRSPASCTARARDTAASPARPATARPTPSGPRTPTTTWPPTQLQGHAGVDRRVQRLPPGAAGQRAGRAARDAPGGRGLGEAHQDQAEGNLSACQPCHGTDFRGTVLSRMFATRTLAGRTLTAGTVVGCYTCHNGPGGGD